MQYDLVIIGGGPGGYVPALYAAKRGMKVAMIERDLVGGTCLNHGCIPTKALLHIAESYHQTKEMSGLGIYTSDVLLDWNVALGKTKAVMDRLRHGTQSLLKAKGVTVVQGFGSITAQDTVLVTMPDQTTIDLKTKNIMIATGSRPSIPPIPGCDLPCILTSDEALSLPSLPSETVVLGGGVIAVELGFVFQTIGVKVTILEMMPQLLPGTDKQVAAIAKSSLEKRGASVHVGTRITSVEQTEKGMRVVFENSDETTSSVTAPVVIAAVGRRPVLPDISGVSVKTERGGIVVDDAMQTSVPGIYAVGDATKKLMLAHVAEHQGIVAVKNMLGEPCKMDYSAVPKCIYIAPEIASVGLTEDEAAERGVKTTVGYFPFSANGRAMTADETEGFVKIVSDEKYHQVLGVHIAGPRASELIAEAVLALRLECTAEEISETIHAHPTFSEAFMESAFDVMGLPIHKI